MSDKAPRQFGSARSLIVIIASDFDAPDESGFGFDYAPEPTQAEIDANYMDQLMLDRCGALAPGATVQEQHTGRLGVITSERPGFGPGLDRVFGVRFAYGTFGVLARDLQVVIVAAQKGGEF